MQASQELTDVRPAHRFDEAALASYLSGILGPSKEPLVVRQFEGGQSNPTFLLTFGGEQYVLRKKPPGELLPTAHMVEREYRIVGALAQSDVPVPRTFCLCEDPSVIGTPFYVMEFVRGRIFWNPALPELPPGERRALYEEMNRVLSALHAVDYEAAKLTDFGKPGNYFARQVRRWTQQYVAAKTEDFPEMDRLIEWLPNNIPDDDETTIVHGDFRMDNMVFHPTEPRVLAVLDWELSTLGHPLADLAYNCLPYHVSRGGAPALGEIAGEESAIMPEEEYVRRYCERKGRAPIQNWNFYLAFSLFRLASIAQGVYKRALQGNASSDRAHSLVHTARTSATVAYRLASS